MSTSLAEAVDVWRAAAAGLCVEGVLDGARLPRLASLAALDKPIWVQLRFVQIEPQWLTTEIQVEGEIGLRCQRCLDTFDYQLKLDARVLVAANERQAMALEQRGEVMVSAQDELLELAPMVEDELLLSLPFAPRHPPGTCKPAAVPKSPEVRDAQAEHPFAALSRWKRDQGEGSSS